MTGRPLPGDVGFRCAAASADREEPLAGTASTVRAFLLLENPGPWGVNALRDARLPDGLGDELAARTRASGVRVLLIRRIGRQLEPRHGIRVIAAYAHHTRPWLECADLADIHEVHDLDVEALGAGHSPGLTPHAGPVFAVCTHGRHDTCCAERGRPVAAGLAAVHPEATWEVSHIGGDRFAANLLVLPHGLYYGRLDPAAAVGIAEAHLDRRIELKHLRGRSGMAMSLQAAEIALRRHLNLDGFDAVRFVSRRVSGSLGAAEGHDTEATFDVHLAGGVDSDPVRYLVDVRSHYAPDRQVLTCKSRQEDLVPVHEVHEIRRLS